MGRGTGISTLFIVMYSFGVLLEVPNNNQKHTKGYFKQKLGVVQTEVNRC
ncbi:hypothetical protein SAMN04488508_103378 [Aquimarina spongiae]|uniref:Uncharacterized protein n=1 Tax=Aquimarina spongiae TaxID=570521 RepID=A0A1M6EES7_9FLAO|nr:hypothetical protein SAMN04488508_103378 [Aquimarina spongiae]